MMRRLVPCFVWLSGSMAWASPEGVGSNPANIRGSQVNHTVFSGEFYTRRLSQVRAFAATLDLAVTYELIDRVPQPSWPNIGVASPREFSVLSLDGPVGEYAKPFHFRPFDRHYTDVSDLVRDAAVSDSGLHSHNVTFSLASVHFACSVEVFRSVHKELYVDFPELKIQPKKLLEGVGIVGTIAGQSQQVIDAVMRLRGAGSRNSGFHFKYKEVEAPGRSPLAGRRRLRK